MSQMLRHMLANIWQSSQATKNKRQATQQQKQQTDFPAIGLVLWLFETVGCVGIFNKSEATPSPTTPGEETGVTMGPRTSRTSRTWKQILDCQWAGLWFPGTGPRVGQTPGTPGTPRTRRTEPGAFGPLRRLELVLSPGERASLPKGSHAACNMIRHMQIKRVWIVPPLLSTF